MCPGLEAQREALWHDVIKKMPNALASDITQLNPKSKTTLLLSCLGCGFVKEWANTYESIARYVHKMYKYRSDEYKEII